MVFSCSNCFSDTSGCQRERKETLILGTETTITVCGNRPLTLTPHQHPTSPHHHNSCPSSLSQYSPNQLHQCCQFGLPGRGLRPAAAMLSSLGEDTGRRLSSIRHSIIAGACMCVLRWPWRSHWISTHGNVTVGDGNVTLCDRGVTIDSIEV